MYGDANTNNFAPHRVLVRAEAAAMLVRLFTPGIGNVEGASHPFGDVREDAWYAEYVAIAYTEGLVYGRTAVRFAPAGQVTREEFAAMVTRAMGGLVDEEEMTEIAFADAALISDWALQYVYSVHYHDWMIGRPNGNFAPLNGLRRSEAAATVNRLLGRVVVDTESIAEVFEDIRIFDDVPGPVEEQWFFYYVIEATNSHRYVRVEIEGAEPDEYGKIPTREIWIEVFDPWAVVDDDDDDDV